MNDNRSHYRHNQLTHIPNTDKAILSLNLYLYLLWDINMDTVAYVNVYDELIESIVKTVTLVPWQVSTDYVCSWT